MPGENNSARTGSGRAQNNLVRARSAQTNLVRAESGRTRSGRAQTNSVRALLGGAFDPPHAGHVCLARAALAGLPVGGVFVLPNGDPRHRGVCAPWADRVAMCEIAFAGIPKVEIRRDESPARPRFSAETLRALRSENPAAGIIFILGADAFAGLESWREWREIFSLAHLAVAPRQDAPKVAPTLKGFCKNRFCKNPERLESGAGLVLQWEVSCPEVSSTALRERLGRTGGGGGDLISEMIPRGVLEYARERKLY